MLKEYRKRLTHHIQDAYLGVPGLKIAFQGVKQPFLLKIQRNVQVLMFHIILSDDQA